MSGTWYFSSLFLFIFMTVSLVLPPSHSFLSVSLFQEKTIRVLLIPKRSRAQRTTTTDDPLKSYLRGLASGWFYKSISPSLSLTISPSKVSPSSPDRGIQRSRRYPPPVFAGPLSWPAAIQRSAKRPKSSTKEWYCQGHSSLDAPSELNPPQRIPSPLYTALLVPQAKG